RRGLQNLGYSEGRKITLEVRYPGGRSDRAGEIATEFVRLGVNVIVSHFTPAVRAAMGATQTIPIVMAPAGAPLQSGFIDSLARLAKTSTHALNRYSCNNRCSNSLYLNHFRPK